MTKVIIPETEQRQAADPATCVWVSANAGSGKTRVLTDRVIRILLQQPRPEPGRILCLTFTKAAAAEMKDRLFARLGKWALMAEADLKAELTALTGVSPSRETVLRARRMFALALETPGGLKVQTIHAFCESILHRFPMEAGVQPGFEVLDDQTKSAMFAGALDEAIGNIANSENLRGALEIIATRVGLDKLSKLVEETAKAVREGQLTNDIEPKLRQIFGLGSNTTPDGLEEELREGMDKSALLRAAKAKEQGTNPEQENLYKLTNFLRDKKQSQFESYRSIFLTQKNGPQRYVSTKESRKADPQCEDIMRVEQSRLYDLRQQELGLRLVDDITSLGLFSGVVSDAYHKAKLQRGVLDYDDLIRKTAELLETSDMAPWVLYKLDGGLDHILVDESQDTSPDQWRVITGLADEFLSGEGRGDQTRTMFAVGDEKQSIYSFQGADPRVVATTRKWFKTKAEGAHLSWQEPRLETSFRSTPAVLQFVDEVFTNPEARVGLQEDGDETVTHRANRQNQQGRVELWQVEESVPKSEIDNNWLMPVDLPDEQSGVVKLAKRIAGTIRKWLDDETALPSRGRPLRPDDMLILLRSRGVLFFALARELKRKNIPLAGVDRMVLTDEIAVMDLLAVGRFCLMPDDDLTLATILKSPLIGLSEEDLFDLAYDRQQSSLWQMLKQAAGKDRFIEAHDILAELLNLADQMPPFAWFSHILERQGGRCKMLARLGAEANDPLDEFLNRAIAFERKFTPSLQGFIDWMEKGATEIKREQDRGHEGVRLMTIHGAKGLEANVVFLPDSCKKPDGKHIPPLITLNAEGGEVVVWPRSRGMIENPTLVAEAVEAEKEHALEEYHRLLYVAMTRARDWLIICGALNLKQKEADEGSWYDLVKPAMEKLGTQDVNKRVYEVAGSEIDQEEIDDPEMKVAQLPAIFTDLPSPESFPPKPLVPSNLVGDEPGPGSGETTDRALALNRGNLIHRLLEFLPDMTPETRREAGLALVNKYGSALSEAEQMNALGETIAILDHPDFAEVFSPGSQAEVSVVGLVRALGPYAISGQIDRLMVTAEDVLIVDYKTNRRAPDRIEDVPKAYLSQLAAYRAALAEIYPHHRLRTALLWTASPSLMEIPQEMLAAMEPFLKERSLP